MTVRGVSIRGRRRTRRGVIAVRLKVIDIFRGIIVGQRRAGLVRGRQIQQNDVIGRRETNIFRRQTTVHNFAIVQGLDGPEDLMGQVQFFNGSQERTTTQSIGQGRIDGGT